MTIEFLQRIVCLCLRNCLCCIDNVPCKICCYTRIEKEPVCLNYKPVQLGIYAFSVTVKTTTAMSQAD